MDKHLVIERKFNKVHVEPQSTTFKCSHCLGPAKLRCSRCGSVKYCGKNCQKEDWKVHKDFCQEIYRLKKQVEKNADIVENFPDLLFGLGSNNYFESDIGYFWEYGITRCYCNSRKELALTLYKCGQINDSGLAYELSLEHMLDLIWLCRGDDFGMRVYVPSIYCMLQRQQEAYDFLKFWNKFDSDFYDDFEDENPIIFPNLKGENIFEELTNLEFNTHAEELVSLFLIKYLAFMELKRIEFVNSKKDYDTFLSVIGESDNPVIKAVGNCSLVLDLIQEYVMGNVNFKVKAVKKQLVLVHALFSYMNPFIVPCFLHSPRILKLKISRIYERGSFEEAFYLVTQQYFNWFKVPGMFRHVKKLFFRFYGKEKAGYIIKEFKNAISDYF